jgi:hypothetical protein
MWSPRIPDIYRMLTLKAVRVVIQASCRANDVFIVLVLAMFNARHTQKVVNIIRPCLLASGHRLAASPSNVKVAQFHHVSDPTKRRQIMKIYAMIDELIGT